MADCTVAEKHIGGKTNKIFGVALTVRSFSPSLLAIHRWGCLTAEQIARLNGQKISYVQKKLLPHLCQGATAPLKCIQPTRPRMGPRLPYLYALTRAGYGQLEEMVEWSWDEEPELAIGKFVPPIDQVFWDERMGHRLATIDALIAAEASAAKGLGNVMIADMVAEFRFWDGKRHPTAMRNRDGQRMKPDAAIMLRRDGQSWVDFLEIDMGTEAVSSARAGATIEGKFRHYWSIMSSAMITERFAVTSSLFRVLIITTAEPRIATMASTLEDCGLPPIDGIRAKDVFLFSTHERCRDDFYGAHWRRSDGMTLSPVVGDRHAA